jgi:hypothetical protein
MAKIRFVDGARERNTYKPTPKNTAKDMDIPVYDTNDYIPVVSELERAANDAKDVLARGVGSPAKWVWNKVTDPWGGINKIATQIAEFELQNRLTADQQARARAEVSAMEDEFRAMDVAAGRDDRTKRLEIYKLDAYARAQRSAEMFHRARIIAGIKADHGLAPDVSELFDNIDPQTLKPFETPGFENPEYKHRGVVNLGGRINPRRPIVDDPSGVIPGGQKKYNVIALMLANQRFEGSVAVEADEKFKNLVAALAVQHDIQLKGEEMQRRMQTVREMVDQQKRKLDPSWQPEAIGEPDVSTPHPSPQNDSEPSRGARDIIDDVVAGMEDPMNDMADGIARNSEAIEKFLFGGRRGVTGGRGVNRRPDVNPAAQALQDVQAHAEQVAKLERERVERESDEQERTERREQLQKEQEEAEEAYQAAWERGRDQYLRDLEVYPDDNSQDLATVQAYEELDRIRRERELTIEEQERYIEPLPEQYHSTLPNGRSVAEEVAKDYPLSQNAIDNIDWGAKNFHGQTIADVRLQEMYEEGISRIREEAMEQQRAMTYQEQQAELANMIAQVVEKEVLAAAQSRLADQVRAAQEAQKLQEAQQVQPEPQIEDPAPQQPEAVQPEPQIEEPAPQQPEAVQPEPQIEEPAPQQPEAVQPEPQIEEPAPQQPEAVQPEPQIEEPAPQQPEAVQPEPQIEEPAPQQPEAVQPEPQIEEPAPQQPEAVQPEPQIEEPAPQQPEAVQPEQPQVATPAQPAPTQDAPESYPRAKDRERPAMESVSPFRMGPGWKGMDPEKAKRLAVQGLMNGIAEQQRLIEAKFDAIKREGESSAAAIANAKDETGAPEVEPMGMDGGAGGQQANDAAVQKAVLETISRQHMQDIAKQLQGGTPASDPNVTGLVGRNAQGDNVCVVNDENGNVRAWGIYGDDGTPLMTRGEDEWKKALTAAASRDLKAREEKQKQATAQPKKDEPEHVVVPESSYDDRFISL